jgi:hypothetical protein
MPTMQGTVVVPANAPSANVLAGQKWEFVAPGASVSLSATGSANGLNVTFDAGMLLIDDQELNTQNRYPIIPDDLLHQGQVPGGRMILRFRNTTAGALTGRWRIDL